MSTQNNSNDISPKANFKKPITIAFVDRHSRGCQHLSGNTSLIIAFLHSLQNLYQVTPIYFCQESSEREARQWMGKIILHKNLVISSSRKVLQKRPSLYIYIYPQYRHFPIYFTRWLCGIPQIAVSHGHLNSFNAEYTFQSMAVRIIKLNFLKLFNNIIVYSDYVALKCSTRVPDLILRKTFVVTEIISTPYSISK